jgi:CheY-like chemotaxis protein
MKILYIEDNDDNVYVMRTRLGRTGFIVLVAADAEQGLTMAAVERPDLILMDLGLPGIDGWEATRRLKAAAETKHIPIIAVSAHAMTGDREKALEAGCDDYDTKPIDFARLRAKIEKLVLEDPPR